MEGGRKSLSFHDPFCGRGAAEWRALHLRKEGKEDGKLGAFPNKELEQELVPRREGRGEEATHREGEIQGEIPVGTHMEEAFPSLLEQ